MQSLWNQITQVVGAFIPNLVGALIILVIGLIIAWVLALVTRAILRRTTLDDRIARFETRLEEAETHLRKKIEQENVQERAKVELALKELNDARAHTRELNVSVEAKMKAMREELAAAAAELNEQKSLADEAVMDFELRSA